MDFFTRIFERVASSSKQDSQREDPQNYKTAATRIEDSLHELHKPNGVPSMQVLFFHDFQWMDQTDVHLSTWKTADGSHLWPETWFVEEFPDAHVLCVEYWSRRGRGGYAGPDIYNIAENLLSDMISVKIGQIPHCPVILVGHGFGGLLIKQVCVNAGMTRFPSGRSNFLNSIKAVFFYSTPHHGFSIPPKVLRSCNISEPLVALAEPLSEKTSRLNEQFRNLNIYFKWRLVGFGETEPTKLGLFGSFLIVPEGSSRSGMDQYWRFKSDHFSVCTPDSKSSPWFQHLNSGIQHILDITRTEREAGNGEVKEREAGNGEVQEREAGNGEVQDKEAVNGEYGTWTKVGQLFVNDKIDGMLGSGSSGTSVFEGVLVPELEGRQENAVGPRPIKVAVKRLLTAHYKKAQREIDLLVTIRSHQNVVRYWCVKETKDFIYLGLERCNCSLHDLICAQSGKVVNMEEEVKQRLHGKGLKLRTEEDYKLWDEDKQQSLQLLLVLRGIVDGLVHLHSQRIAHRDLKPHNILIIMGGAEMQPKIADMGLSKQWADTPISSELLSSDGHPGTRGWQAPEQLRREKLDEGSSQAADMFCLGCVLYYCITEGEHPFGDEVDRESNIICGKMNLFQGGKIISAEAEHLIERLLDPVSANRPSARKVLNHPFFWNHEKRLSFLIDASDRLEGDRKKRPVPQFVADVESRMSKIQCSGWDSYVDPRLLNVKNRPNYDCTLVRELLRLIRNRAHHFEDADSKAVLKSKPEGIVKYFASKFRRLLIEIYDVVGKHYEADDSFQKYYSVDT